MTTAHIGRGVLAAIVCVVMSACGARIADGPTSPTPVTLTSAIVSLNVTASGSSTPSFQLTATARLADGSAVDVTQNAVWESSDPSLASVSLGGLVTVKDSGNVTMRATYGGMTAALDLTVAQATVVSITISGGASPASSFQLIATAQLTDGSRQDVSGLCTWDSSSPATAAISQSGLVTVLGSGTVTFRATYRGADGSAVLFVSLR